MTMREKLARACATALTGGSPSKPKSIDYAAVDAILNVLREPSEDMDEKGQEVCNAAYLEVDEVPADAHFVWQAMIDTIINEGRG